MSDPRDTIARAIFTTREFTAAAAFGVPIDAKTECAEGIADAVIAALGLTEERDIYELDLSVLRRHVTPWTQGD